MIKFSVMKDCGMGSLKIIHLKVLYVHTEVTDNECVDKLSGKGSKIRYENMIKFQPRDRFRNKYVLLV